MDYISQSLQQLDQHDQQQHQFNDDNKPTTNNNNTVIYTRDHFSTEFDTNAYLNDFYTNIDDPAMQMILCFLPSIVARLPPTKKLLDFGAGPTIHVATCFRNNANEIYLADYLPQNRDELIKWKNNESKFDWSSAIKMILTREGNEWTKIPQVIDETRNKVKDIFYCNCFDNPSIKCPKELNENFDIITSFFTLEYCCNNHDEYKQGIQNVVKQVSPGGYFIMGGIFEETWCSFGGRKFTCLYITRDFMLQCLRDANLLVDDDQQTHILDINGMFLICAKKADK